ncbi:MAG TPA: hypothetical protein VF559_04810 [Caulobacteraceae bacterium]|jgi:hypothetical protein
MTSKLLLGCGAAALLLAACDGPPPAPPGVGPNALLKVPARLDCPDRQGDLERVRVAPDGRSCAYRDQDNGATVDLALTPVSGGADATLAGIESRLRAEKPAAAPAKMAKGDDEGAASDAAAASDEASDADWEGHDVNVDVDHPVRVRLPGMAIDARDESAKVRIGSLRIDANGDSDHVSVKREPRSGIGRRFSLEAGDDKVEIRTDDGGKANVNAMLILASDEHGGRGRAMGYLARGPRTGPLVVATVRMSDADHDEVMDDHHGFDDVQALVKRNVKRR